MTHEPPPDEVRSHPRHADSGCFVALSVVMGVILLAPGLCALILAAQGLRTGLSWFVFIVLAFAGMTMIAAAMKGRGVGTPVAEPPRSASQPEQQDMNTGIVLFALFVVLLLSLFLL